MSRRRFDLPPVPPPSPRYVLGAFHPEHRGIRLDEEFEVRQRAWIFVVWTNQGPQALARRAGGNKEWYLTQDWFGHAYRYDDHDSARRAFKQVRLLKAHPKRAIVEVETRHTLHVDPWVAEGFDIVERIGALDEDTPADEVERMRKVFSEEPW